jgi:hypothetical protein
MAVAVNATTQRGVITVFDQCINALPISPTHSGGNRFHG